MKPVLKIVLFSILLLLAACGKKGPVMPLKANLPAAVKDVELMQRGDELLLSWRLPTDNQDGTPLTSAPAVDVYRMLYDPADDCPECTDRSTLLYSINPELPQPATLSGGRYLLHDRQVAAGQGYHYRLVPRDAAGQPGQPLVRRIVFSAPPASPINLRAEAHDRSAVLSWQPVDPEPGRVLLGYHVYRREEGNDTPPRLITPRPVTDLQYNDFNLQNGTTYHYRIRALLKQGSRVLESLPSMSVPVTPRPE